MTNPQEDHSAGLDSMPASQRARQAAAPAGCRRTWEGFRVPRFLLTALAGLLAAAAPAAPVGKVIEYRAGDTTRALTC